MPTRSSTPGRSRLLPGLLAFALGGALTIPLVAATAQATQLQPLDLAALSERASAVVVGVVEGQRASWTDAQRSSIVTDVRVRVTRALRGAAVGEVVTVRRLGGSIDGIGMRVAGEAGFTQGEEILLFAEGRGGSLYSVGMTQGKMHVATENGRKVVYGSLAGAELVASPAGVRSAAAAGPRLLDDVLREVQGYLDARDAREARDARQGRKAAQ